MALRVDCDYCGEAIEGWYATIDTHGRHNDDYGKNVERRAFHFHSGERDDDGSCYRQVLRLLTDAKAWAHREEGAAMSWLLVERPTMRSEGGCDIASDEWHSRFSETDLPTDGLNYKARGALITAGLWKLEQVASCDKETLLSIGHVGPKTVVVLRRALEERGFSLRERGKVA